MARKMVNLAVEETSGVDHPAHLAEGWIIMKHAQRDDVLAAVTALAADAEEALTVNDDTEIIETEQPAETVAEVAVESEQPVDELVKAHERIAELEAALTELQSRVDTEPQTDEQSDDALLKAAPAAVVEMLQKARDEAETAREELRKEREQQRDREFVAKAAGWSHLSIDAESFGPALRRLHDIAPEIGEIVGKALDAANAQAESGAIFTEIGKPAALSETGSAYERIQSLAKSAVAGGEYSTIEQAIAGLVAKNPDLYHDYLASRD